MLWMIIGTAGVVLVAALSLWASFDSRRDILSGTPRFESVADVTGIWSRETLDRMLGPRDAEDCYRVTPDQIREIRRRAWKVWLDSDVGDLACIVVALVAPFVYTINGSIGIVLLACSGGFVLLGYVWAAFLVVRSRASSEDGQST